MLKKQLGKNVNEQLYIDARLNFAIKHPLDWKRLQIPVSSPQYRDDTIRWQIAAPQSQNHDPGELLIRSTAADPDMKSTDLLNNYAPTQAELTTGPVEALVLPAGPATKLLGQEDEHSRLTVAIKGKDRDFIISLDFPSNRLEELLPTFQDLIKSLTEVSTPNQQ